MNATQFKKIREKLALTQGRLAEELGITIRTVNSYENGAEIPRKIELAMLYLKQNVSP